MTNETLVWLKKRRYTAEQIRELFCMEVVPLGSPNHERFLREYPQMADIWPPSPWMVIPKTADPD